MNPLFFLTILFFFLMTGCGATSTGSKSAPDQSASEKALAEGNNQWFCQVGDNSQAWDCTQDGDPAANLKPRRLPQTAASVQRDRPRAAEGSNSALLVPPSYAQNPPRAQAGPNTSNSAAVANRSVQPPASAASATPAPNTDASRRPEAPKHIQLSYRPETPVAIMDLPATYWIVQLISVSDRESLEEYANAHALQGMSAARVWAQEQFFYVLILGVYESYDIAKEASSELPPPFDEQKPWIRSVGSLQKAMLAADREAGNAQP